MLTLDAVRFDTTGLHVHGETACTRTWSTAWGHLIGVGIKPGPSTLLAMLREPSAAVKFRDAVARSGQGLVELTPIQRDGWVLVRMIAKGVVDEVTGHGRSYVGVLTIPFREGSIVVRTSAYEAGGTGIRESEVGAELTASGAVLWKDPPSVPDDGPVWLGPGDILEGWLTDPADPTPPHLARCVADDPMYDADFPDHPLTRVRGLLDQIQESMHVAPEAWPVTSFSSETPTRWWHRWRKR